jgi:hypothetical protein
VGEVTGGGGGCRPAHPSSNDATSAAEGQRVIGGL